VRGGEETRFAMKRSARLGAMACAALLLLTGSVRGAETRGGEAGGGAAALFEKSCYSCHNIGGGDKRGPDLMNVTERRSTEWLHKFIASPQGMKRAGDKTASELFAKYAPEVMPDQTFSADQIDQILGLIKDLSSKQQTFIPVSGRLVRQPTTKDIPIGKSLFVGARKLSAGGPACIGCHSVTGVGLFSGGTLGGDLTQAALKYKDVELASIIKAPALPTMAKVFAQHEVTDEEVVQLFAFLQSARKLRPQETESGVKFLGAGAVGMVLLFALSGVVWRGRLRAVRAELRRAR